MSPDTIERFMTLSPFLFLAPRCLSPQPTVHFRYVHGKSSLYLPCRFSQLSIEIPGATRWNTIQPSGNEISSGVPMTFNSKLTEPKGKYRLLFIGMCKWVMPRYVWVKDATHLSDWWQILFFFGLRCLLPQPTARFRANHGPVLQKMSHGRPKMSHGPQKVGSNSNMNVYITNSRSVLY